MQEGNNKNLKKDGRSLTQFSGNRDIRELKKRNWEVRFNADSKGLQHSADIGEQMRYFHKIPEN